MELLFLHIKQSHSPAQLYAEMMIAEPPKIDRGYWFAKILLFTILAPRQSRRIKTTPGLTGMKT